MNTAVLKKAVNSIKSKEISTEDFVKLFLLECLKSIDKEQELESEDIDYDYNRKEKSIEVDFDDENYIDIKLTGFYSVDTEERTHDYPGSETHTLLDTDVEVSFNGSDLTDDEILKALD